MALRVVVDRGKKCVVEASEVLQDLANGRGKYAQAKLVSLEKDAVELATHAEMLAERLEAVDKFQQEKDAELLRQSGELGRQEEELQAQKKRVDSNLAGQKQVLQDKESKLLSAERTLQIAERELRKETTKKKTTVERCTNIGVFVSGFIPAIDATDGARIGTIAGRIQNFFSESVEDARSHRNRCKEHVDKAKSDVRLSENEIVDFESKMRSLASDVVCIKQKIDDLHRKRDEIKKVIIPIVKEAIKFWHLFRGLSKIGEDRNKILEKIVEKAKKKQNIFLSRGTQRMTSTFIETWADIEKEAGNAAGHFVVVDFSCTRCKQRCSELPHLSGSDFVCSTCHLALKGVELVSNPGR